MTTAASGFWISDARAGGEEHRYKPERGDEGGDQHRPQTQGGTLDDRVLDDLPARRAAH